ncbi:MAG: hypothetical protein M1546_04520 [Chloroflexi bacterium]|nr:hypothetical protein [Chloroflexota bacterium]
MLQTHRLGQVEQRPVSCLGPSARAVHLAQQVQVAKQSARHSAELRYLHPLLVLFDLDRAQVWAFERARGPMLLIKRWPAVVIRVRVI